MNKLFMMIGLPASGKSTIAKEISESEEAIIVSSDEIRKELLGDVNDQNNNELVFKEVEKRIIEGLKVGNVIYDATNINYKKRMAFLQKLNKLEVEKIAVLVAVPYEECLSRNKDRERKIPEEVITRMYHNFYVPQYFEGFNDIQIRFNTEIEFDRALLFERMDKFNQDNPHHQLTLGEHCRKCAEILTEHDSFNLLTIFAGLLHDIGKINTKSFVNSKGETTEIGHYYNHEKVGAYMSLFYTKDLCLINIREILYIAQLIQWHMLPWQELSKKTIDKYKNRFGKDFWKDLMILHKADEGAH